MAGAGFSSVGGFTKGPSLAPKPPGARLSGLRAPKPPGPAGASFTQTSSTPRPPRAAAPVVPAATPPASSSSSTPGVDPRDSAYYENIAGNNLKVGNQINALNAQSGNLQTGLQNALAQLAYQQPRDQLKLMQGANQRGALYSSVYGQDLGNLNHQYLDKQSGLQQAEGQKVAALNAQIAGLKQGIRLYNAGQYDAAVARAIKAAAANPGTGQPAVTPASPVPAAAPARAVPAAKPPAAAVRKNGTLNVYVPKVKSGFGYRGGF